MADQQTGYVFTERDKAEFNRIRHKVDTVMGPGVTNRPDSISIAIPNQPTKRATPAAKLPTPQYQWMVLGAISQNQLGAFFVPAVSMSMT